jgi:hypothetical protein
MILYSFAGLFKLFLSMQKLLAVPLVESYASRSHSKVLFFHLKTFYNSVKKLRQVITVQWEGCE